MKKIIVDTGRAGIPRLKAALKEGELDIIGITVAPDAANYGDLCAAAANISADVPVYMGAQRPLLNSRYISDKFYPAQTTDHRFAPLHRSNFMIECAEKYDELEIICLGPVSNVALAILKNEKAMAKVKRFYVAGGALLGYHTTNPVAHHNILADCEAAETVFKFTVPITLIPANVCRDIYTAAFSIANGGTFEHWDAFLSVDTSLGFTRGQTIIDLVGRNPINGVEVTGEKQTVVTAVKL